MARSIGSLVNNPLQRSDPLQDARGVVATSFEHDAPQDCRRCYRSVVGTSLPSVIQSPARWDSFSILEKSKAL
jgi:hypothetical protein